MKIKKGDNVIVISGKDKGKSGKVLETLNKLEKVIVEGVNVSKKHVKAKKSAGIKKGEVIEKTMPIHVSNVMIEDPKTKKPSRIGYLIENDKKVRISRKSGQKI
jgi:large subunit ribosomal protein L24